MRPKLIIFLFKGLIRSAEDFRFLIVTMGEGRERERDDKDYLIFVM